MDLSSFIYNILASFLIVMRRSIHLILFPYKTMRNIASERDVTQIIIIISFILLYFVGAEKIRPGSYIPVIQIIFVLLHYLGTVAFVYLFGTFMGKKIDLKNALFLFAYALIPTLAWFYVNTFLYILVPPPRTLSVLGKTFSILFITLSVSILAWKIILWYLAVRFTTKMKFYDILFISLIYLAIVTPYAMVMYVIGVFRIPFI